MALRYTGFDFVTKHTFLGYPFRVARKEPLVPRLDDRFLDCAIYLYPSQSLASEGKSIGGTGFLAALSASRNWLIDGTCSHSDFHHLYAVSNRHVVEKHPVVRLNTHDGTVEIVPLEASNWIKSEQDDLAICPLNYQQAYRFMSISVDDFLTEEIAKRHDIGIGDDVFMVGRFVNHEGRQRNLPAMRWGHVSMMPFEPVFHPTNRSQLQESFLVEVHSISGFSGSPVFVRPVATSKVHLRASMTNASVSSIIQHPIGGTWLGPWLLGVDWGYINKHDQQRNNTGMSGVVPAWRLLTLMKCQEAITLRRLEQIELQSRAQGGTTLT